MNQKAQDRELFKLKVCLAKLRKLGMVVNVSGGVKVPFTFNIKSIREILYPKK
jgi:rRNA processing protein Gar1